MQSACPAMTMRIATKVPPRLAAMACRAQRGALRLLGSAVVTAATLIAALLAQEISGAGVATADAGALARAWQRFDAALSARAAGLHVPPREPAAAQSKPAPAAATNPQPAAPPPAAASQQSPPQAAAQVRRTPTGGYEYIPAVVCRNGSCVGGAVAREPVIPIVAPKPASAPSAAATPVQPVVIRHPQPGTVPPREPAPRTPIPSPPAATPAPAPPPAAPVASPPATPAPAPPMANAAVTPTAAPAVTSTAAPVLAPTVQPAVSVPPPQAGGSAAVPATPAPKTVVPAATTVIIHAGDQANPAAGKAISEVTPIVRGHGLRAFQAAVETDVLEEQRARRKAKAHAGATFAEAAATAPKPRALRPLAGGRGSARAARSAVALQASAKAYRQASVQPSAPAPVLIALVGGRGIGQTADLGRGSPSHGAAPDVFNTSHHVVAPAGCASRLIVKSAYFRRDSFGKPLTIACR